MSPSGFFEKCSLRLDTLAFIVYGLDMSRTSHHRYSTPDPWRVGAKMERKARSAGRLRLVIEDELTEKDED